MKLQKLITLPIVLLAMFLFSCGENDLINEIDPMPEAAAFIIDPPTEDPIRPKAPLITDEIDPESQPALLGEAMGSGGGGSAPGSSYLTGDINNGTYIYIYLSRIEIAITWKTVNGIFQAYSSYRLLKEGWLEEVANNTSCDKNQIIYIEKTLNFYNHSSETTPSNQYIIKEKIDVKKLFK